MVVQEPKDNRRCRKMFDGFKTGRANDFQRISNQYRALLKGSEDVVRTSRTFLSNSSSETQGQLVGTGKSLKRAKKNSGEEKSRTRRRAPGDNALTDQFQTVRQVLASDLCQKTFVFFCPITEQQD